MGAAQSQSPKVVIEQARRGIGTEFRPEPRPKNSEATLR